MKKEFVPYEQALALKELGFNEPCFRGWSMEKQVFYHPDSDIVLDNPTFSQAFRWFRENYNIHSYIEGAYPWFRFYINSEDNRYEGHKHSLYEEAELACLIKLIEIVKN